MLILRVEDINGSGPYCGYNASGGARKALGLKTVYDNDDTKHPNPHEDRRLRKVWSRLQRPSLYSFGFANPSQYFRWFDTVASRRCLDNDGFRLVVYLSKAANAHVGSRQAVFRDADKIAALACNISTRGLRAKWKSFQSVYD